MEIENPTLSQYDVVTKGGAVVTVTSKDDVIKVFRDNYKQQDLALSLSADVDGVEAVFLVREIAAIVKTGEGA